MERKTAQALARWIRQAETGRRPFLVAIDGRCASGKTTLAETLGTVFACDVIHMDHFFLRPEQRTAARYRTPGENVDHERFLEEVLTPLRQGTLTAYRPYDCGRQCLGAPIRIRPAAIQIVEGSYACHPALWDAYDLRIFLTVDPETQRRRIEKRNGKAVAAVFREKWIPLEEAYFSAGRIPERCDGCFVLEEKGENT